ncbi:BQ2448_7059 [Microbotryum intermedium]|uniref:BQ2448_7059 protein n=1 Tax=Microbotryum intermedium TaxID=269621 RepID=A0A238FMN1_9BASI|nr:BQ2448_7059 [Microbotryum intermedium]
MTQLSTLEQTTVAQLEQMGFPKADAVRVVVRKGPNFDQALDALLTGENLGDDTEIMVDSAPPAPPAPLTSTIDAATTTETSEDANGDDGDDDDEKLPPPYGPASSASTSSYGPRDYHEARPISNAIVPFKPPRSKWSPDVDLTLDEEIDPTKQSSSTHGGFDPYQLADALEQSTRGRRFNVGPSSSSSATINASSTDEDSDYQRAIAMSMQEAGMSSSNSNIATTFSATTTDAKMVGPEQQRKPGDSTQDLGLGAGDNDIEKAISLSLGDLRDHPGPGGGLIEAIKPEDRVRQHVLSLTSLLHRPVIVRSTSALLGILSSFIQCLCAVPTWRKAVLEFRPNQFDLGCAKSLQGIWNGTQPPALEGAARDVKDPVWAIVAIQRLFALMQETKRSFLHITEVTQALDPNSLLLLPNRRDPVEDLQILIDGLIETFRNYSTLDAKALPLEERPLATQRVVQKFSLSGKTFNNNPVSLAEPLEENVPSSIGDSIAVRVSSFTLVDTPPTNTQIHLHGSKILRLRVPSFFIGTSSPTLYQFIDANLNEPPLMALDKPASFSLITHFSQSLIVRLERYDQGITSLDDFGSFSNQDHLPSQDGDTTVEESASKKRSRRGVKFEEALWLDRYDASRRVEIAEKSALLSDLRRQMADLEAMRRRLARTSEGKEALGLLREAKEYLEKDEGEFGGDAGRERRRRLKATCDKIEEELEKKIRGCDEVIEELRQRIDGTFDGDEWKKRGPYELKAVLMRNGMNGRGSSWAVVKDEGKWWRIKDLEKEEVTFEQVASDPSGLMMSAGAALLFYDNPNFAPQNDGTETETSINIPSMLRYLVLQDNHSFASELPSEVVNAWTPPLEPLPLTPPISEEEPWVDRLSRPATPRIDLAPPDLATSSPPLSVTGYHGPTATEEVIEILPPAEADQTPFSPVAVDLAIDDEVPPYEDSTMTDDFKKVSHSPKVVREPLAGTDGSLMAVDEQADGLRLRGGASDDVEMEGGEDQDYSDEDEFDDDDDEVELGLLQPMSSRDSEWNIDFAIGKVGGKPVWLDPRSPLGSSQVACAKCGATMAMLLQINSPDDTRAHAAARSLYVYACPRKECSTKDVGTAMKVFRVQMPSPNEFYPHTKETQKRRQGLGDFEM